MTKNHSGKVYLLESWPFNSVFLTHPDSAQELLKSTKNISKGVIMSLLKDWLADGLAFSTGPKWWNRRRLLTPAFHFNILQHFLDVMNEQSALFIKRISTMVDAGKEFDVHHVLANLTLDVICETAMGVQVNAQSGETLEYAKAIERYKLVHSVKLF